MSPYMSSWVSYSSNYYCLLLAVAEGAACVACVAHLVSKVSMKQAWCHKCIIKHTVNALFMVT